MAIAKCFRCGGSGVADTYEQARKLINHAVGLSRGIKCGDNYNVVQDITPKVTTKPKTKPDETTYSKVEKKSGDKVVLDEAKTISSINPKEKKTQTNAKGSKK